MEEKLINIISEQTDVPREEVTLDSSLVELGIDSMSMVVLVSVIEASFNVKLNTAKIANVYTVGDLIPLLKHE